MCTFKVGDTLRVKEGERREKSRRNPCHSQTVQLQTTQEKPGNAHIKFTYTPEPAAGHQKDT